MTDLDRAPVTVLGLGPMGRALAGALARAGHPTTVWNRTAARADALVARGVRRADTVADAVTASPLVLACVIDYAAVQAIVDPVAPSLKARTLVNLTADTPQRARDAAAWAAAHGIDYLDGAIMTPAPTIGGPEALILYSGPAEVYETHRASLASLGGSAVHLGPDPGRAAAYDVALLDVFWTGMTGIAHALALARAENITGAELAPYAKGIGGLLPTFIDDLARRMDHDDHSADISNIASAYAGMAHIIDAAQAHGIDAGALRTANAVARRMIDAGHGDDNFSRMIQGFTGAR
ncbi:NAD(P)-binding domain-containing protein [Micromonospora sp. NPDC050200]|uniref:NAD(P)-dependent oxidoreductase n=1 Tax=Micromonospora sp. NPDC050200 TaxID=3155664 RepID=UPI0033E4459C